MPDRPGHVTKSPNDSATRCGGLRAMRMGAAMMRFESNPDLTRTLCGLAALTLLVVGAIVFQIAGPAEKDIRTTGHSEVRTRAAPENGGPVNLDIGVADLRGSVP